MANLRKKNEAEKRLKGMTAKEILIGIDVGTLNQQVEERTHRELVEKELEECNDAHQLLIGNHMNLIEIAKQQKRKELEVETQAFNHTHLKKEDRREFYLNDPHILKNQAPTRMSDHDPRLGVSSAQIFVGEDVLKRERDRVQHEQQRAWVQAQLYEKTLKDEQQREEDKELHEHEVHVYNLRGAIGNQELQQRKELERRVAEANIALIAKKQERTAKAEEDRKEAEKADVEGQYNSAFLNEGTMESKASALDAKIAVRNLLTAQQQQKRAADIAEAQERMAMDQQTEQTRRMLLCIEKERRGVVRNNKIAVLKENQNIAEEQRARREESRRERLLAPVGNIFDNA